MSRTNRKIALFAILAPLAILLIGTTNPQTPEKPTGIDVHITEDRHVLVTWREDTAPFHRVGWVSEQDMLASATSEDGMDAFNYADTARSSSYTVKHLAPNQKYWFTVGAIEKRFGTATWGESTYLVTPPVPGPVVTNTRVEYGQTPTVHAVIETIYDLPWVADGFANIPEDGGETPDEEYAVYGLEYLASQRPMLVADLIRQPLIQDGLSFPEADAIYGLHEIGRESMFAAEQLARLIMFDSVEPHEVDILSQLNPRYNPALDYQHLEWLVTQPGLAQSASEVRAGTLAMLKLELLKPDVAAIIKTWPWVQDGITPDESAGAMTVTNLAIHSNDLLQFLTSANWITDELNSDELQVLNQLNSLNYGYTPTHERNLESYLRIVEMPFLEKISGADAAAVEVLTNLFLAYPNEDYFEQVMQHPVVQDGITDAEALVITHLETVIRERPEFLATILDFDPSAVETRTVDLPLAGGVLIAVLHLNPGTYTTMDQLEDIIMTQEAFMNTPFPKSYTGLLAAPISINLGTSGRNGLMHVEPPYVEDNYVLAHEMAHIYWHGGSTWIAEGAADFMSALSTDEYPIGGYLCEGHTLSEEDNLPRLCNYDMGSQLFQDLHEAIGTEPFREAFTRLYLAISDPSPYQDCRRRPEMGFCFVSNAFVHNAEPNAAAIAEPIIAYWYFGPR